MDFDEVLEEIGQFGRYQVINYVLICLPVLFSAANSLTYVFTAGVPRYRCHVPGCDDEENASYSAPWLPEVIPPSEQENSAWSNTYTPDQCFMYTPESNFTDNSCALGHFSNDKVKCDSWIYEDNERTIVGEWNITCIENQWKLSLVGTVHFAGILMGSIVFGLLADRFGRKLVFVFCILLMSVTGIAQAVSPDYITFQVFVFINALGTAGVYPLAFIIGVELVGKQKREMSGIILNYFYAVGEAAVGLVAWLTKDWMAIQLAVSAPPALFALYYWFIPESVRWLLAKNMNRKAGKIVKKAAKVNRVVLSERLLSSFDERKTKSEKGEDMAEEKEAQGIMKTIIQICKSKSCFCVPSTCFIIDLNWAVILLFLIGKLGITSSFGVIVVYTAELYPTVMRSIGVGTSSTVARVGAMVAPFAPLLGIYMQALPLLLFGIVSFIAGVLALFFPETLGTRLPDTVEELENL
ncbi:organic cation transporter protein [Periplaneta americana]|uniref:organic cation transporter protein n=1 Tax=Periplaneta americana TaxID=6978 RepID=UPI0037E93BC8